jgi:hypothetical protein
MAGYFKIRCCCALAASMGYRYVWIDTCCIDKTSSAELSEAINSMFKWYKYARQCFAYLSDVPRSDEKPDAANSAFRQSRWFTRGWTLQELLASSEVWFYNSEWDCIGDKRNMAELISSITCIESDYLNRTKWIGKASVAKKMSWASKRGTTRLEDRAYSLLGIFDVNMPLIYGEVLSQTSARDLEGI